MTLELSPDGDFLAVGSDNGLHLLLVEEGEEIYHLPLEDPVMAFDFFADGESIAFGYQNTVGIWDAETEETLYIPDVLGQTIPVELELSPDDRFLAIPLLGNEIAIWDVQMEEISQTIEDSGKIVWYPGSETIGLFSCLPTEENVWNIETGEQLYTIDLGEHRAEGVTGPCSFPSACGCDAVVRSDGLTYVAERIWRHVFIWEMEAGERVNELELENVVSDIEWSPDGSILAIGFENGATVLWGVDNNETLYTLGGHSGRVYNLRWSSNGSTLASVSDAEHIVVWHIRP
jgi:WD40 repeat protein